MIRAGFYPWIIFFDRINPPEVRRINTINKIFFIPAGRQVLNILPARLALRTRMAGRSILSKKWDLYIQVRRVFLRNRYFSATHKGLAYVRVILLGRLSIANNLA
jgi:hypothetical protein